MYPYAKNSMWWCNKYILPNFAGSNEKRTRTSPELNFCYLITLYFGFGKESIKVNEILEVYQTHNPITSSAASLDRIVLKSKRSEIMCSVKEKARLFEELEKRNHDIIFR